MDNTTKFNTYIQALNQYVIREGNSKVPAIHIEKLNEKSCKSPKECKISPHCWNLTEDMNIFTLRESNETSKRLFNNK